MKKNNYDLYENGQEISGITFQQHQNQVIDSINAIMLALGLPSSTPVILYGLEDSGIGQNHSITAGAMFINGEIFMVDAFSGTTVDIGDFVYLKPLNIAIGDDIRFGDGTIAAVHFDHKYELAIGTPTLGADEFAYASTERFSDKLNALLGANTYTDQQVTNILGGVDTDMNSLAKIAAAVDGLQGGGSSNMPLEYAIDYRNRDTSRNLSSNDPIHIESADIPANSISATVQRPRVITIFCDLFYREDGSSDFFTLSIIYREGTSGSWTPIRSKKLQSNSQSLTIPIRAQLILTSPNTQVLQFGIRQVHDSGESVNFPATSNIEFDVIY